MPEWASGILRGGAEYFWSKGVGVVMYGGKFQTLVTTTLEKSRKMMK